jgi:hypothetical protein
MSTCPGSIDTLGYRPGNWTFSHDIALPLLCDYMPKLLYFSMQNSVEDTDDHRPVYAATTYRGSRLKMSAMGVYAFGAPGPDETTASLDMQMGWKDGDTDPITPQVVTAATQIQDFIGAATSVNSTVAFAHYGNAVVGIYAGRGIVNRGFAVGALGDFISRVETNGMSQTLLFQRCGNGLSSDVTMGIVADTSGGLKALNTVKDMVSHWRRAECVTDGVDGTSDFKNTTVWLTAVAADLLAGGGSQNATVSLNGTAGLSRTRRTAPLRRASQAAAAECTTTEVHTGDSCGSLATKCGISGADFTKYNSKSDLCSTLAEGQHVCCSSGSLPDFAPKPNADGSCATYHIQAGEGCSVIAAKFSITIDKLESFNKETWGWPTCDRYMVVDQAICVSTGSPPMPAPIQDTKCGPQMLGTQRPSGDFELAKLNPCPLNACCDIWGQCGTTEDFCTDTRGNGAPGTAKTGTNGCISNCGMDIIPGDKPPAEYRSVGYFEAWNDNRPCLWMEATDIDPKKYTHIHFAFARLKADFSIDVAYVQRQFDKFKKLSGVKKVLAFGGWSDSTSRDSFLILRNMVLPANRNQVAQNIADFISANNLDGVDIDWEYPGEPDIVGIPAASETEGIDYLKFLTVLRSKLPSDKTLSIAAPASYWVSDL